jgi:type IV secretion system protein VirB8
MAGKEIKMLYRKIVSFNTFRSFKYLAHVLFSLNILQGLMNIAMVCFVMSLFPLKEIQPMLLSFTDHQNQVVRIQPFARSIEGRKLMTEKLVMRYVELREAIDGITDNQRTKEIHMYSDPPLYEAFRNLVKSDNPKSPVVEFYKKNMTRSVHVKRCLCLEPDAPNTYRIEWESIDYLHNQEVERKQWITTLTVKFEARDVKYEDQYMNPLGLTVTNYTISKKEF